MDVNDQSGGGVLALTAPHLERDASLLHCVRDGPGWLWGQASPVETAQGCARP